MNIENDGTHFWVLAVPLGFAELSGDALSVLAHEVLHPACLHSFNLRSLLYQHEFEPVGRGDVSADYLRLLNIHPKLF